MFKIGLENNTEGRSIAWVLGHPGCFSYGRNGDEALAAIPREIQDYRRWLLEMNEQSWLPEPENGQDLYQLEETWDCYSINDTFDIVSEGYEVNAFFRHDWLSLTDEEIQRGLQILSWGRVALLNLVANETVDLDRTYPGERWSISGILKHIGGAEWWYMDRLGLAFPRSDVPEDPFQRLEKVRTHLKIVLPSLAGSRQVVGVDGEFWSPRKLLRRAVWHEYDHIEHIRKLL